jgi:hypothetical protein
MHKVTQRELIPIPYNQGPFRDRANPAAALPATKIYGDEASTQFKTFVQEPGWVWGHNDVLIGDRISGVLTKSSCFGTTKKGVSYLPKLYLHISNSFWSSFTGMLRKFCLPWRWKAVYLKEGNDPAPKPILICTNVHQGKLSDRLNALVRQSLFITNLIDDNRYEEIFGREYLKVPSQSGEQSIRFAHPLGECVGLRITGTTNVDFCHIRRIRGVFSFFQYHLLKRLSSNWKEVIIHAGDVSERVLMKKSNQS